MMTSGLLLRLGLLAILSIGINSAPLPNDQTVSINSADDASRKRQELIHYLWGPGGFPKDRLPNLITNIAPPVKQLSNLKRVDELRIDLSPGLEGLAYHFVPDRANRELVIVHHGNGC